MTSIWEIRRFEYEADAKAWDEFVSLSRNSTFLFQRGYMDYHADRFEDCSLMAYRNCKLAAILPANLSGKTLWSHQGLTYGGWLLPPYGPDGTEIIGLWNEWLLWCQAQGISEIVYKSMPTIYQSMPSQEDLYLLFLTNASLARTDLASTLIPTKNPGFNKLQRRHLAHSPSQIEISVISGSENDESIREFHNLLCGCLRERHDAGPVHSYEELKALMERFPDNIEIWIVSYENTMQAAVCLYKTANCNHCQYIATSEEGRRKNLLTPLFKALIDMTADEQKDFFDFGTSNEDGGRVLNAGLNRQKTSYGASGVAYQQWIIDVTVAAKSLSTALQK